jgi:hypothetical protein
VPSLEEGPLTVEEAENELADRSEIRLIAVTSGSIPDMKQLRARCLAAGIPVLMGCPPGAGASCGGAKTHLLVEESAIPRVAELLRGDWRDALAREGLSPTALPREEEIEGDHPPCPACGTAAALVDGACSDCGLALG